MFLRALKTAPRPLPPPLAWLWVLPTVPRRLPLPPPTLVWMLTRIRFRPWSPLYCRSRTLVSRRRRSDAVRAGREPKLTAWHFTPLRTAKSITIQRTREGSMRGVRTGGAHDHSVDCPSPSMPLVYVSRLQTTRPDGARGGRMRRVTTGRAHDCSVDCPSPSGHLVYVSRLQTARPDG